MLTNCGKVSMRETDTHRQEAEQSAYEAPRITLIGRIEELTKGTKSTLHPDVVNKLSQ
jgi:hypothetical protein